ncbi:MAG: Succinyl-CoA ligase (ADP-forming) subunit alpha [Methanomassiliicoccales archaeon PtaU1.Bin124]|nr:MAG: Succinyl-CoA ligase (ADP-forming) subunit alpha [Methanomassiliicoccales archaeon PtaU1.Bin124]
MTVFGMNNNMPVIVQGMTGHQGRIHGRLMTEFGTNVVAGVVPGKGGSKVDGWDIFENVDEAVNEFNAEASVIFVPASSCLAATMDAIGSGLKIIVIVTEHLPVKDALLIRNAADHKGVTVIGPNSPGVGMPGIVKLGIMPNQIFLPGDVGVISRSGTLTYELVQELTDNRVGQRCCIGVGGDPIVGKSMTEVAREYCNDDDIRSVLLVGEIGGRVEIEAARVLADRFDGPVFSFLAGRSAPPGKRMGHAGAIMSKGMPGIGEKIDELLSLNVIVCRSMAEVGTMIKMATPVH